MNVDDTDEKALLTGWANDAQDDVQEFHTWWFLEHEFSITPVASTRLYAFPTTDLESNTVVLESINIDSVHTVKGDLKFFWPDQQDRANPGWMNAANAAGIGNPEYWSVLRRQVVFDVAPNADWVTGNPSVYFRGYVGLTALSADGDTSGIPAEWHRALVEGAKWRAMQYQDPLGASWKALKDDYDARGRRFGKQSLLEQMVERCRPVRGGPRKVTVPSIFKLPGRRSVNARN